MPTKVYVGNLPDNCNPDSLRGLFGPYGEITELTVIKNFAFVHFLEEEHANNAVQDLHKTKLSGKQITVEVSKSQRSRDGGRQGSDRRDRDYRHDDRRDDRRGSSRRPNMNHPINPSLGGILGAAPVDQGVLNNLGIFSAVNTLAAAAAAEQQNRQEQQNRYNDREQPDPDVRVRREVVHTRDVPNARNLGLSNGYVIYERYYVDKDHPLLKGLPVPELPRMTDTYAHSRESFRDEKSFDHRDDHYDKFRDRSPVNHARRDDFDRDDARSRDYGY